MSVFGRQCKFLVGVIISVFHLIQIHSDPLGGNASDILFRRYMADLGDYLTQNVGICIGDIILVHLLWADDLILVSDSIEGIQRQLNGLLQFCSDNLMFANEIKTKIIVFGSKEKIIVFFNGKPIEQVGQYRYLGNISSPISYTTGDMFKHTKYVDKICLI